MCWCVSVQHPAGAFFPWVLLRTHTHTSAHIFITDDLQLFFLKLNKSQTQNTSVVIVSFLFFAMLSLAIRKGLKTWHLRFSLHARTGRICLCCLLFSIFFVEKKFLSWDYFGFSWICKLHCCQIVKIKREFLMFWLDLILKHMGSEQLLKEFIYCVKFFRLSNTVHISLSTWALVFSSY